LQKRTKELGLTVEAGAVPALPQLYKCRCFMDRALAQDEVVYFNAGEYERLVAMSMHDFKTLVTPVVLSFAHEINSNIRCASSVPISDLAHACDSIPLVIAFTGTLVHHVHSDELKCSAGMCKRF
jgi:hypothetical protein